ncbi:hypothetical protein ACEPAH_1611 [Sanghuangporus vaninii]
MFTETLLNCNFFWVYGATALVAIALVVQFVIYLTDSHCIRGNGISGPLLAKFSDAWLGWVAAHGHRSEVVNDLHKKYGSFVRLAPNHVSICEPDAIPIIYGHGNGTIKSDFYDLFFQFRHNVFSTQSRAEHARKRKVISHVFSQKSVLGFEPYIRQHVSELLEQWDKLCEGGRKGISGNDGEGGWEGRLGRAWFNCKPWFSYWAFDVIGDLAFGAPFGMVRNGRDAAPVAVDQKVAMAEYGKGEYVNDAESVCAVREVPAVKVLDDRSEYAPSLGVLPPWFRPLIRQLPWFARQKDALRDFVGVAVAAVAKRLAFPTDRPDILSKLQQGKDEEGRPMGKEELTAEAFAQLIAGSDTIANSACATTYYVAANSRVQAKLQKELDEALGADVSDNPVTTYAQVKNLPYLEAVINEAMRIHSTAGLGLPRVVPDGGLTVCGKTFPKGTVLSVPMYSVHRDPEVWGADADVFRPERWFEDDLSKLQKSFHPFSFGPRACVGRNLAMTELLIIMSSIFRRFDIVLEQYNVSLHTTEGFIRKADDCRIGIKLRARTAIQDFRIGRMSHFACYVFLARVQR